MIVAHVLYQASPKFHLESQSDYFFQKDIISSIRRLQQAALKELCRRGQDKPKRAFHVYLSDLFWNYICRKSGLTPRKGKRYKMKVSSRSLILMSQCIEQSNQHDYERLHVIYFRKWCSTTRIMINFSVLLLKRIFVLKNL